MKTHLLIVLLLITSTIGCQKDDVQNESFWETATALEVGWIGDSLNYAVDNAQNLNNFYSLLVIKDGKILKEEYFNGKNRSDHFHLRSITKSVISLLAGIAIDKGFITGINQSISDFYPEYSSSEHQLITIEHLLTMSSGVKWDEENEVISLLEHKSGDPAALFFNKEVESDPGSTFNYSTLSTHLLGLIIARSSGMELDDFCEKYLFNPIGIESYKWERDINNKVWGSTGLQLRSRDIGRIGLLMLNEGIWEGTQVVSSSWVQNSISTQIDIESSPSTYGFQWWIAEHLLHRMVLAQGFGGQTLMIIPEKDIMIIATQEHYVGFETSSSQWSNFLSKIFWPIFRSIN